MDLTKMSIEALKAAGYDQLAAMENLQKNLGMINQEISKRMSEPKAVPTEKKDEKRS